MKRTIIEARVKRQEIPELAGNFYLPRSKVTTKIPLLEKLCEEDILFGIYKSNSVWTVLTLRHLYASDGINMFRLKLNKESSQIHDYFGKEGHKFDSDVQLENGRVIWMHSAALSCRIQNIILLLENILDETPID